MGNSFFRQKPIPYIKDKYFSSNNLNWTQYISSMIGLKTEENRKVLGDEKELREPRF